MMRSPVIYSLVLAMVAMVQGANWPHFRGPQFNGSSDERNLPVQWSQTENVRWSVDLPGASAATPIIWGDSVFVSSSNAENAGMVAMSFNRKTGKLLWKHEQSGPINQDERPCRPVCLVGIPEEWLISDHTHTANFVEF